MRTSFITEKNEIEEILDGLSTCFVGMNEADGSPYVIPMNFGYKDDVVYLHSGPEGNAVRSLTANPDICITFCTDSVITHQNEEVACSYRVQGSSVICRGRVEFVEDFDEKVEALNILMEQYTERPFKYSDPAVRNVKIWKIKIDRISGKIFGVPYKKSHEYK